MADIEYFEDGPVHVAAAEQAPVPSGMTTIINWIGALMSVALIVGMAIWAWQLTVRDVSGVPVIRALEGPMRVTPEDPGGTVTDHQGLAVNRITEGAEAAPAADRIVLAPAPLDLEEIDLSSASLPEIAQPVVQSDSEATLALIDRLLEEAVPLAPLSDSAEQAAGVPEVATTETSSSRGTIAVIPATVPGISRSVRPHLRPADLRIALIDRAAAPVATLTSVTELAPDTLAVGTRLVQLGAFDDADTARVEWDRLVRLHPDFFRGKDRVVQQAVSGGREFFRLRAHGFSDLSDARRFCTALNAQGAPCIPVTVR